MSLPKNCGRRVFPVPPCPLSGLDSEPQPCRAPYIVLANTFLGHERVEFVQYSPLFYVAWIATCGWETDNFDVLTILIESDKSPSPE